MVNYLSTSTLAIAALLSSAINSMAVPAELTGRSPRPVVQMNCYSTSNCTGASQDIFYADSYNNDTSGMCVLTNNCECMQVAWLNNVHFNYGNSEDCSSAYKTFNNGCNPIINDDKSVTIKSPGTNSISFCDGCDE